MTGGDEATFEGFQRRGRLKAVFHVIERDDLCRREFNSAPPGDVIRGRNGDFRAGLACATAKFADDAGDGKVVPRDVGAGRNDTIGTWWQRG